MRIALFETSSHGGGVAIADDQRILASKRLDPDRKHARDLAPAFDELTRGLDLDPRSLDLVLVNVGPGSYTGLRVGIMSARTLAWATGAILVGVDAMSSLAASALRSRGGLRRTDGSETLGTITADDSVSEGDAAPARIRVIIDGQRGLVYAADFIPDDDRINDPPATARRTNAPLELSSDLGMAATMPESKVRILAATDWAAELRDGDFVTGPALERYESLLPAEVGRAPSANRQPDLEELRQVGMIRHRAGHRDDPMSLEPLYLRASSAELKWAARKSGSG